MIDIYHEVGKLSQEMLEFARQMEWDALIETGNARAEMMKLIPSMQDLEKASQEQREQIILLIEQIQACDHEITILTRAWMGELDSILGSMGAVKKLQRTYKE